MKRKANISELSAFELITESFILIKNLPILQIGSYYIGTMPFMIVFLFFWATMSFNPDGINQLGLYSIILVILFIWMKTWQAIFTQNLKKQIYQEKVSYKVRDFIRITKIQLLTQPIGIISVPLSIFTLFFFPLFYSYHQNLTVLSTSDDEISEIRRKAWKFAGTERKQNLLLTWLLSPYQLIFGLSLLLLILPIIEKSVPEVPFYLLFSFGLIGLIPLNPFGFAVALNISVFIFQIPYLLKIFFGFETIFTISGPYFFNTTFLMVIIVFTYLCLDPLIKAVYTLRCFYLETKVNGDDIKLKLNSIIHKKNIKTIFSSMILLLFFLCTFSKLNAVNDLVNDSADNLEISKSDFDKAVESTFQKSIYKWRIIDDNKRIDEDKNSFFYSIKTTIRKIVKFFAKIIRKIIEFFTGEEQSIKYQKKSKIDFSISLKIILLLLIIISVVLILKIFIKFQRKEKETLQNEMEEIIPLPDLKKDEVNIQQYSDSGWMDLAKEYEEKGDLLLALRAIFLAILAFLASQKLITLKKFKSIRNYKDELFRKVHQNQDILNIYIENAYIFEKIWYGNETVNLEIIQNLKIDFRILKTNAKK